MRSDGSKAASNRLDVPTTTTSVKPMEVNREGSPASLTMAPVGRKTVARSKRGSMTPTVAPGP